MQGTCNSCKKASSELKRCAKCTTTLYCSRDCQKTDWKTHKKICGKQTHESLGTDSAGTVLSPPKGLEKPITKPFTRLDNNTYLHERPEEDVYRDIGVLIDSYRLRIEDEYNLEGKAAVDNIYGGAESSLPGFRKFLQLAAGQAGLLPPWWNDQTQKACEELGMGSSQWQDLRRALEKSDVIEHYGDPRFAMQLRILAEMVTGRGFPGNGGTQVRKMMAMMEGGGMGGRPMYAATVDAVTGTSSILQS
ncbi:hypothetical protein E0Z10_g1274 [Xylaria hypoxylon]|uniref:MYND-type domain-containing protein n=1 Tax=Xylaria hypoxylon TaxID=37992 RepID=A0A4Z0YSZ9_9PEZI|nr:hypothetical protein E0Z10_g1274 [Xylaria hypoxylon]